MVIVIVICRYRWVNTAAPVVQLPIAPDGAQVGYIHRYKYTYTYTCTHTHIYRYI